MLTSTGRKSRVKHSTGKQLSMQKKNGNNNHGRGLRSSTGQTSPINHSTGKVNELQREEDEQVATIPEPPSAS